MRYFLANAVHPIEYISCGNLLSKQEFIHPKRILDSYVLILVKEGSLYITQNGVNYELHSNQYIFLKALEEHVGFKPSPGKLSYLWAHFLLQEEETIVRMNPFSSEDMIEATNMPLSSVYIMPEHGNISLTKKVPLLFNQLLDLSRQENIYSNQILNYAISLLVMEISQELVDKIHKTNLVSPSFIAIIMEWIRANYYKPLSVASIASEFGYNPDYLSAIFKKSTQASLVHFINKTRIDISKSLIINYDITIKEAAYSCGFQDEKYFMKTFKKFENITPTQYKKAFSQKRINVN